MGVLLLPSNVARGLEGENSESLTRILGNVHVCCVLCVCYMGVCVCMCVCAHVHSGQRSDSHSGTLEGRARADDELEARARSCCCSPTWATNTEESQVRVPLDQWCAGNCLTASSPKRQP